MKSLYFIAALIVALIAALTIWHWNGTSTTQTNTETKTPQPQTYTSANLGVSFVYPDTYTVQESDVSAEGLPFHTIVLMDKQDAAHIPQNGEGPTAITFQFFVNDHKAKTLEEWIRTTQASNFQLSPDKVLTPRTVAGASGFSYTWDGLYRGQSVVFPHGDHVIIASVTSMATQDPILSDFESILSSLTLK